MLVVDDEPLIGETVKHMLTFDGHTYNYIHPGSK